MALFSNGAIRYVRARPLITVNIVLLLGVGFATDAAAQEIVIKTIYFDGKYSSFTAGHRDGLYKHKALMLRPAGHGPFPLVVLSHGTPRKLKDAGRRRGILKRYIPAAREFAKLGWATFLFVRRGYDGSPGKIFDGRGRCNNTNYELAGLSTAEEIRQAVLALSKSRFIDATRVIIAGVSSGGWGSLAAAGENIPGMKAIVNFVGGRGSAGRNKTCQPKKLVKAFAFMGKRAKVPSLWIYATRDSYLAEPLVRRAHKAFVRASRSKVTFYMLKGTGREGHFVYRNAVHIWRPLLKRFLKRHNLQVDR